MTMMAKCQLSVFQLAGKIEVSEVNGFKLRLTGGMPAILVVHDDRAGCIANVANCLAMHNVNIGHMEVSRIERGLTALMVIDRSKYYFDKNRKYMRQVLDDFGAVLPDAIPQHLQDAYKLVSVRDGLEGIHFPQNAEHAKQARRRFAYEELLNFQLRIQALRKIRKDTEHGTIIQFDLQKLRAFIASLPYELTGAQKRVVNEICKDLKAPHRMNRLLQGDVGSGEKQLWQLFAYMLL
ncbi:ATP-dependent DNA helicase RecG OS=Lysinibacillus sphaericus OX=1421 GN=recG PE=3 SV=1 [Lysinibacillus sphaericus]